MKSFSVVMVATMSLFGFFAPTNSLSCYDCRWTDKCATDTDDKLPKVVCGAAGSTAAAGEETTAEAPPARAHALDDEAPAGGETTAAAAAAETFFCFKAQIKGNDTAIERGCKLTPGNDDCKPLTGEAEKCEACKEPENCNGGPVGGSSMVTGSMMQCAFILALARMLSSQKK